MGTEEKTVWNISFSIPAVGYFNRLVIKMPFLGKTILDLSNRWIGKMLPYARVLGFRKEAMFESLG
jgi:hypothetical protein